MRIKQIQFQWHVILLGVWLFSAIAWSNYNVCPPCSSCHHQTGSYPNCHCEDECHGCESCSSGSCVDRDSNCGDPACWDCSGGACSCTVNMGSVTGSDIVCIGADATFGVSGVCSCIDWSGGGTPSSANGTCSFTTHWDTSGEYTVTATPDCGGGDGTKTVTVVEVGSVTESPAVACVGDDVIFTAVSSPADKPMDCLVWERRYRAESYHDWGNWSSAGGGVTQTLNTSTPGYYQYRARNGSGDTWKESSEVMIVYVNLSLAGGSPLGGDICTNAQDACKKAYWQAVVEPNTLATVTVTGQATGGGTVRDEDIVSVNSSGEDTVGSYTVTITHNDCGDCPVTKGPKNVFKFVNTELTEGTTTRPAMPQGGAEADLEGKDVYANGPINGGATMYAAIHTPYYFKILTEPAGVYGGDVKAIVAAEVCAGGAIKIKKQRPPSEPHSNSLSLSFMFISVSESWQTGGDEPYGCALADTDSRITFLGWSNEHLDFYKTHDNVLTGYDDGWASYTWTVALEHGLETPATAKPTLSINTNYHIDWEIAVGSAVGEDDSVQIPLNQRHQNNIEYEVREYEIPMP